MELNRLSRVIRERWRVVALVAIIGFVSAFGFTAVANRDVNRSFEALVSLRWVPQEGQTVEDLASQIEEARGLAVLAAEDLLAENPGFNIFGNTATGQLLFRAVAGTSAEALEHARALLQTYLETDPGVGGNLNEQLAGLVEEATAVANEMKAIQKVLTPEEQGLVSQHDVLDQSIAAVQAEIVRLTVADAGASASDQAANAERRADLKETLDALSAQKANLPPRPETELSVSEQLRLDALNRRLDLLRIDYERLALRTMGVVGEGAQTEAPTVNDLTPAPANPIVNGVVGLLGGAGLAIFGLVFITRSRKEVWLAEDLPIPVLGEIPQRRVTGLPGPAWYDTAVGGKRKEAIQATRTALEGWLDHEPGAFAISGDRVGSVARHTLAVDLAAAFASAGRSVLVVDADYGEPVEITEFQLGEPSLASVLKLPAGFPDPMDERVDDYLSDVVHIRADLAVMPAGDSPSSPTDSLAGPQFRHLVHRARERFDLVIAVCGEPDTAAAQVVMQRLGAAIIAIAPGKSTVPRINSMLVDLTQQRVELPGVVMMGRMEARVGIPKPTQATRARMPRPVAPLTEPETLSRLRFYPFPGSKRSTSPMDGSLDHLAEGLAGSRVGGPAESVFAGEEDDSIGFEIVEALTTSDQERAFGPVAEYVVARVEDLMTAVPGQPNVSDDLVDAVRERAFIPLTKVKGIPTVGERLVSELKGEVGGKLGNRLAAEMSRALTGDDADPAKTLNIWLAQEFFKRHVQRTDREPEVWHLTSNEGTIQVLVNGRRLTDERLARMTTDVVRRSIDEMEGRLKAARSDEDVEMSRELEFRLKDAHLFEIAIGLLRGGDNDEARLVYPWRRNDARPRGWQPIWTEGVRPNIAPLQRLEILAERVLTDEELSELLPTG